MITLSVTQHPELHYPSLMYSTGPGGKSPPRLPAPAPGAVYPATVYRESAAHQGEDVALYATGPHAELLRGLLDQHQIPHILAYAANIGPGLRCCEN